MGAGAVAAAECDGAFKVRSSDCGGTLIVIVVTLMFIKPRRDL